jgi:hypothetical protein
MTRSWSTALDPNKLRAVTPGKSYVVTGLPVNGYKYTALFNDASSKIS